MAVARPPDEMRPQGYNRHSVATVGGQHRALGERLAVRVVTEKPAGIRIGFVDVLLRAAVVDHARARRVDGLGDPLLAAGVDDVQRALRVHAVIELPRSPDAGDGGHVKHRVDVAAGGPYGPGVAHVALLPLDTQLAQPAVRMAAKNAH